MNLTDDEILELERLIHEQEVYESRESLIEFAKKMMPGFDETQFHKTYYHILLLFAKGLIKRLMVTIPPQTGKAVQVDTPVLTTDGWVNHGDLKPGMFVYGEGGKKVKVLEVHKKSLVESSKVHIAGYNPIIASNNHEWVVLCDREKYRNRNASGTKRVKEKLETSQLLLGQRRNPAIQSDNVIEGEHKELPIDPYILGCWLGDGNSEGGRLTCGVQDIDHFKKFGSYREVKPGIYNIRIEGLTKTLRLNNLQYNKHIPKDYLFSSVEQRLELLRGLMDTDGCIDTRHRCEFTQKTGQLSIDFYQLVRSLGIKATFNTYVAKIYGADKGFKDRITFSRPVYEVFKLKRKLERQRFDGRKDGDRFFIDKVEPIGKRLVNCITVEGGLYLVGKDLVLTHNSTGSTIMLPSFLFGIDPNKKIAVGSYSTTFARKFNREIQRVIDTPQYHEIFPETTLNASNVVTISSSYLRNSEEFEIVGYKGSLKAVGRGGPLTGNPVDIMIMDDLYKDASEGNSPVIREGVWDWYSSVVQKRLHNKSQELIVFTRWHQDDLIGLLEKKDKVVLIESIDDIEALGPDFDGWIKINFEAIKESEPTPIDPRQKGEALYPERQGLKKLLKEREQDPEKFNCMNQGNPISQEGLMYKPFGSYVELPQIKIKKSYVDTADKGTDYLCAVHYAVPLDANDDRRFVLDVVYSQEAMETTEPLLAKSLDNNQIDECIVESNNGGRGFARAVEQIVNGKTEISWKHQSKNKEARIVSNSATVNRRIVFPEGWEKRWPTFYEHLRFYKKLFNANKQDGIPDVLTGIVEQDVEGSSTEIYW